MKSKTKNKNRRVALITGANGAIGKAIARNIALEPGFEVVLACRNAAKAAAAVAEVQRATGNPAVRYELVDVARRATVRALAQRWDGPLHILINNAAETPRQRRETEEGIERQFATNVLGYFWMHQAFRNKLRAAESARVVNVASYWAGGLDLEDLEFKHRGYNNDQAYRQSKQANRMLTVAFAQRLEADGIRVNACHPGDVHSALSNSLGFGGHQSPDEGARTPVWLATQALGGAVTGKYFEHQREMRCRFGEDRAAVEALYDACIRYA